MKAKKIFTGIAAAALVLLLGAVSFSAAETAGAKIATNSGSSGLCVFWGEVCSFTDENGDGVCDFYTERSGLQTNPGQNFADDNNSGICDNYEQNRCGGCGRQSGRRGYGRRGSCGR